MGEAYELMLERTAAGIDRLGKLEKETEPKVAHLLGEAKETAVELGELTREEADRIADYERGVARFAPHASYLTVNISSPNTPGLRDRFLRGIPMSRLGVPDDIKGVVMFLASDASGFITGSVLAFLTFGPMVDIKSSLMFLGVFKRKVVVYLIVLPMLLTWSVSPAEERTIAVVAAHLIDGAPLPAEADLRRHA